VLADGTNTYVWNAESQITKAAGVNYTYDGDGDRVQKSNGKIYWYGAGSEILDESDASGNITDEYVFFGGKRIAHRVVSGNAIYYYAEDFLGSSRVMTTSTGTVCYDADFYPFGGERDVTNTCPQNYKFTGKERDAETNNDDFGARYYSSQFGRWISPDWSAIPAPVPYANLTNPQTLNLYAMVHDNPETFADLDGHDIIDLKPLEQRVTKFLDDHPRTGGWRTLPRGTGVNPCTIETRGVPNLFCVLCRKDSGFDFSTSRISIRSGASAFSLPPAATHINSAAKNATAAYAGFAASRTRAWPAAWPFTKDYNRSIFAARMKSLSVRPSILCVQVFTSALPQVRKMSG
jgi:RHS repeat-associated protein